MVSRLASMLQSFYYFDTPRWVIVGSLLPVVMFAIFRGSMTPWRMVAVWIPIVMAISLAIFVLAFVNVHHPRAILPNSVITITPVVQGLSILAYIGVPLGVTLRRIAPRLAEEAEVGFRVLAVILPWMILAMLYVIVAGSLTPDVIPAVRWPVVFTLDSTFFLSRIGIVVVFTWTAGIALGLIVHLRLTRMVMSQNSWIPAVMAIGWLVAALLLSSPQQSTSLLLQVINPLAQGYLVLEFLLTSGRRLWRTPLKSPNYHGNA